MTATFQARLDALYAAIPTFECIPGCTDCCGPVPTTATERRNAPKLLPLDAMVTRMVSTGCADCPYSLAHRCAIYEGRPFMCRIFGAVDDPRLACPHGRGPEKPLTIHQGHELTDRYLRLIEDDR